MGWILVAYFYDQSNSTPWSKHLHSFQFVSSWYLGMFNCSGILEWIVITEHFTYQTVIPVLVCWQRWGQSYLMATIVVTVCGFSTVKWKSHKQMYCFALVGTYRGVLVVNAWWLADSTSSTAFTLSLVVSAEPAKGRRQSTIKTDALLGLRLGLLHLCWITGKVMTSCNQLDFGPPASPNTN